jgi:hypothetical protein
MNTNTPIDNVKIAVDESMFSHYLLEGYVQFKEGADPAREKAVIDLISEFPNMDVQKLKWNYEFKSPMIECFETIQEMKDLLLSNQDILSEDCTHISVLKVFEVEETDLFDLIEASEDKEDN